MCYVGNVRMNLDEDDMGQKVSALFLSMNYLYTAQGMVSEAYHDFCAQNGCCAFHDTRSSNTQICEPGETFEGANWAVVSIGGASILNQTGNYTSYIVINPSSATGSVILHEFGHALNFWAFGLHRSTGGSQTPGEAWANFVRLAYLYGPDHTNPIDYDDVDMEDSVLFCSDSVTPYFEGYDPDYNHPPEESDHYCHPEDSGKNWRMVFWDLFDNHNELVEETDGAETCRAAAADSASLTLPQILEGWHNFQNWPDPYSTANHAILEDDGDKNSSTRNMYDYSANMIVANAAEDPDLATDLENTIVHFNCMTDQSAD